MLAVTTTGCIEGIKAIPIHVEVKITEKGFPGFKIVGLAEGAVRESKVRVLAALSRIGHHFSSESVTVNLVPADIKKSGSSYDLAIAVALLVAKGVVPAESARRFMFLGELTLHSQLMPVSGALPVALCTKNSGKEGLVLPSGNVEEASVVRGIHIIGVKSLNDVMAFLTGRNDVESGDEAPSIKMKNQNEGGEIDSDDEIDIADVKGQHAAKRALSIAAAGGHNILMIGPPGSGKTMLARAFPSILPKLTFEESLETTTIYSVAGLLKNTGRLLVRRPFRSPHHTISYGGLVGGGTPPRPGEISLAHHGVLFLDEFPEFHRWILDTLRQPLEDGTVTISRAWGSVTYPASFTLIAAMNPCPCGALGSPNGSCRCNPETIRRYHSKISGPILDRIDMRVAVPFQNYRVISGPRDEEGMKKIREEVSRARSIQQKRFSSEGLKCRVNAQMSEKSIEKFCKTTDGGKKTLESAVDRFGLSARAYTRILKVARTIADMESEEIIDERHICEALQFRFENLFFVGAEKYCA